MAEVATADTVVANRTAAKTRLTIFRRSPSTRRLHPRQLLVNLDGPWRSTWRLHRRSQAQPRTTARRERRPAPRHRRRLHLRRPRRTAIPTAKATTRARLPQRSGRALNWWRSRRAVGRAKRRAPTNFRRMASSSTSPRRSRIRGSRIRLRFDSYTIPRPPAGNPRVCGTVQESICGRRSYL